MLTYKTRDGDMVDDIVVRHYGALTPELLRQVFEANPGLADRGPMLPPGVAVTLPDAARPSGVTVGVSLWT